MTRDEDTHNGVASADPIERMYAQYSLYVEIVELATQQWSESAEQYWAPASAPLTISSNC